ncbi:MAG TPA: LPS assembly protein LptD, partial [Gammaproteobacteria bacterium]|nr:LPS assembly protein LptD [Gammaproteobacteria bacterium]
MRIIRKTTLCIFLVTGFNLQSALAEQADFQEFNPTEQVFAEPLDSNQYGWVEDPSLLCKGFYHVPVWDVLREDPKWEISADELTMIREGTSTLRGSVQLVYGQRHFFAKELEIFHVEKVLKEIHANSSIIYQDPDLKIQGSSGFWQAENDIIVVYNPHYFYFPRHAHGSARKVTIEEQRKLLLEGASYTTCPPNDPTWKLQGTHIQLNRDTGMGQARHISLHLKSIPIFYWPYLQFPIDNKRHTGFLYPNVGSTTQSGFELSWPLYWNIAPNYDATFTPRVLTERGLDLQNELRYLSSFNSGIFQLHFLPGDRKYKAFRAINLLSPPLEIPLLDPRLQGLEHGNDRLGIRFQHATNFSKYWNLAIDYAYVSDDNYFYDLENDLNSASTNKLNQEVNLHYQNIHWHHWWRLQNIDSLHPLLGPITFEEYGRLPQWAFQGIYPKFARFFSFNLEGEATHFTHKNDPFTDDIVTNGERFYLKPALSLPMERIGGYFKPSVKMDYVGYHLNLSPEHERLFFPNHANRAIPIYAIDTGLFFDKFYPNAYQQTMEPRLYYLYVPFRDQSRYP